MGCSENGIWVIATLFAPRTRDLIIPSFIQAVVLANPVTIMRITYDLRIAILIRLCEEMVRKLRHQDIVLMFSRRSCWIL